MAECFQRGYMTQEHVKQLTEHTLAINLDLLDTVKYVLINKVKQHIGKNEDSNEEID